MYPSISWTPSISCTPFISCTPSIGSQPAKQSKAKQKKTKKNRNNYHSHPTKQPNNQPTNQTNKQNKTKPTNKQTKTTKHLELLVQLRPHDEGPARTQAEKRAGILTNKAQNQPTTETNNQHQRKKQHKPATQHPSSRQSSQVCLLNTRWPIRPTRLPLIYCTSLSFRKSHVYGYYGAKIRLDISCINIYIYGYYCANHAAHDDCWILKLQEKQYCLKGFIGEVMVRLEKGENQLTYQLNLTKLNWWYIPSSASDIASLQLLSWCLCSLCWLSNLLGSHHSPSRWDLAHRSKQICGSAVVWLDVLLGPCVMDFLK